MSWLTETHLRIHGSTLSGGDRAFEDIWLTSVWFQTLVYNLPVALCEHLPWLKSLTTGSSPKRNSWEVVAFVAVGLLLVSDHGSQFLPPSRFPPQCPWELLGIRGQGGPCRGMKEERGSGGAGANPQAFLFGKAGCEGTCQTSPLRGGSPALRAKFRWCAVNHAPSSLLSQASLPQTRAREQLH